MATSFLRRKPARVGKNGVAASNHANTADRKKRAPADWLRYVSLGEIMKNKINTFSILAFTLTLSACAAKQTMPGAERVELVNELPDREKCEFVGEVVGSQGNWFTGDVTSNKNLVIGARNELRNEAYKLGANVVYVQDLKNTNAYGSMGTTNTTGVGKAYKCKH